MQDGWKAVWSLPYVSVAFFPSLKQNFIAYRSSKVCSHPDCIFEIHQLWQSGFSKVYWMHHVTVILTRAIWRLVLYKNHMDFFIGGTIYMSGLGLIEWCVTAISMHYFFFFKLVIFCCIIFHIWVDQLRLIAIKLTLLKNNQNYNTGACKLNKNIPIKHWKSFATAWLF